MGRYYRRRRKNNNKDIELLLKGIIYLFALPILLVIWIIKLCNKNKIIKNYKNKSNNIVNYNCNNNQIYEQQQNIGNNLQNINTEESKYHIKTKTITNNEKYFLDIIKKHFNNKYEIRFQVPLSSVIEKDKDFERQYQNELNRIIDIGIFDKDTSSPLLLIEINDSTHHRKDRQVRDAKVKDICDQANLKLIAFWTEYSNTEQYIIERVSKNLGKDS